VRCGPRLANAELATKLEALMLQGTANAIDFKQADSYASAAADAVAA